MIYERTYKIGVDAVNKEMQMTNRALVVAFQNTASFYSDSFNYGILDIPKTFLTWFVIDWQVEVIKRPTYGDEITIKAWGRDADKYFSYLDFEVYVANTLYAKATSKWVLFNVKNQTYENIPEKILKLYNNDVSVFTEKKLSHMKSLDKYADKEKITIRKSDLDFNNHVNNVKYFDYLTDYSNASEYDIFRITYRKEIKADDTIYLCHSKVDKKDLYAIIDDKDNVKTIIECER